VLAFAVVIRIRCEAPFGRKRVHTNDLGDSNPVAALGLAAFIQLSSQSNRCYAGDGWVVKDVTL